MARSVPIFVMPCMRVVHVLLSTSVLRGLGLLCPPPLLLVDFTAFIVVNEYFMMTI
jgi:hypothetical protein